MYSASEWIFPDLWRFINVLLLIIIIIVKLLAGIHGIRTKRLYRVVICLAEEIKLKDKGSIHNKRLCISDDERNKVDGNVSVS